MVALSLDAMGGPVRDLPLGVTDFATSVRAHGDQFHPRGADLALAGASVAEVVEASRESAVRQGFSEKDRVLSESSWDTSAEVIDGLLAVYAAGASLVQVDNADPAKREHRVGTEHVTAFRS